MVKLFVEGGGDRNEALKTACRKAFHELLARAGINEQPRIIASGGRQRAYEMFCHAIGAGEAALLLVDAEGPVKVRSSWKHVKQRKGDQWEKPSTVSDDDLHLMVQCMEAWFLADREAMSRFFGAGFREAALPAQTTKPEGVSKKDLFDKLKAATKNTKTKGEYGKGEHSFALLATLDPALIRAASPWAERFFARLIDLTSSPNTPKRQRVRPSASRRR